MSDQAPTMADIREAIRLMRERLASGQGTLASAMCRLSLPMAEALLSAHDAARDTDARHDLAQALYPDASPAPPPEWDDLIAQVVSLREQMEEAYDAVGTAWAPAQSLALAIQTKCDWLERMASTPPVVPDGYTVMQLDGRWRLFGEGCTESDPPQLMEQDGDGVCISDDYQDGPVDARAALALCWAVLHDREPQHAGRTVL